MAGSQLKKYVREHWGVPFFTTFILLLLVSGAHLQSGVRQSSNDIAVYAYYSLAIGVALQISLYIKHREGTTEAEQGRAPKEPGKRRWLTARRTLVVVGIVILIVGAVAGETLYAPAIAPVTPDQTFAKLNASNLQPLLFKEPNGTIFVGLTVGNVTGGRLPYTFKAEWSDGSTQTSKDPTFSRSFSNEAVPTHAQIIITSADGQTTMLNVTIPSATSATTSLPTQGLVGYWPFDEATSGKCTSQPVRDLSQNKNNGICIDAPTYVKGKFDGALSFAKASNQYVSFRPSGLPSGSNAISFFAWINFTGATNSGTYGIFGIGEGACSTGTMVALFINSGKLSLISDAVYNTNLAPSANKWHLVGFTYGAGASSATLYLDSTSDSIPVTPLKTKPTFGTIGLDVPSCVDPFQGSIDDVRIYNRTLFSSEINELYTYQPGNP